MGRLVKIYDTTLRDGQQMEGIAYSIEDKVRIAQKLDEFGVHYIEGGWPGANPKDISFFKRIKRVPIRNAKIAAFGSTKKPKIAAEADTNLNMLLEAKTPVITIFGKSWDLHVKDALKVSLEENLSMIRESVRYLKSQGVEVIYDAEHFFDGYKENYEYAIATIKTASEAGADVIVLCDTNGGTMPTELAKIIRIVKSIIRKPLGIHCHNDSGCAVANSLIAVELGVEHVQGTINGYGERCGNADLCAIIPNLKLKYGIDCVPDSSLKSLTSLSHYVAEISNQVPFEKQPFVGYSAFAHKGGVHVSAVQRNPRTYEHVPPESVGNRRRILISDQAGRSAVAIKATEFGVPLSKDMHLTKDVLEKIKKLEYNGYQFEGAEGSFDLLVRKAIGKYQPFFSLEGFRVIVEKLKNKIIAEATIKVKVGDKFEHTASEGSGPVNALDNALRKALVKFYPQLQEMHLTDYKVRVIDAASGTAAKVRVLIESTDGKREWSTVGVSENIIEASWRALVDSIEYKLLKDQEEEKKEK